MPYSQAQLNAESDVDLNAVFRRKLAETLAELAVTAVKTWEKQARPEQLPPTDAWHIWALITGRGWGKTRTGAEWFARRLRQNAGWRGAMVAPTFADGRDQMVEGDSGLRRILERMGVLRQGGWNRSIGEIFLTNGSYAKLYSSEEPERLRGPNNHVAWCDEVGAWKRRKESWDQLMFTLRAGDNPQCAVTTTPKPVEVIKKLIADSRKEGSGVHVVRGHTSENIANLAPHFIRTIYDEYEGTRLGRQELYAEILEDVEGALIKLEWIERDRCSMPLRSFMHPYHNALSHEPDLARVVVAIDPAVTATARSDETGIVVAGSTATDGYILDDRSGTYSPNGWAAAALDAYDEWKADAIIAEVNNGGDMIANTLRMQRPNVNVKVVHATRGKRLRAEPVASLYERGRIHHTRIFPKLEEQLTTWTDEADFSPDRLDAAVWAITDLMVDSVIAAPVFLGVA